MNAQRVTEIRLGLDRERRLWRQEDNGTVTSLGSDWLAFLQSPEMATCKTVITTADRQNAAIIKLLYSLSMEEGRPRQHLLSPPTAPSESAANVLFPPLPGRSSLAASLGGWRRVQRADYVTYTLATVLDELAHDQPMTPTLASKLRELLKAHPASPAVMFPLGGCVLSACRMLVEILDPRWHVDLRKPDAGKRLAGFMGIGLRRRNDSGRSPAPSIKRQRADWLQAAWAGPAGSATPSPDELRPREMFWRLRYSQEGDGGLRVANRVFLSLVSQVWLERLTARRVYASKKTPEGVKICMQPSKSYSPQLFVPHIFFEHSDEMSAFLRVASRLPLLT